MICMEKIVKSLVYVKMMAIVAMSMEHVIVEKDGLVMIVEKNARMVTMGMSV